MCSGCTGLLGNSSSTIMGSKSKGVPRSTGSGISLAGGRLTLRTVLTRCNRGLGGDRLCSRAINLSRTRSVHHGYFDTLRVGVGDGECEGGEESEYYGGPC